MLDQNAKLKNEMKLLGEQLHKLLEKQKEHIVQEINVSVSMIQELGAGIKLINIIKLIFYKRYFEASIGKCTEAVF